MWSSSLKGELFYFMVCAIYFLKDRLIGTGYVAL